MLKMKKLRIKIQSIWEISFTKKISKYKYKKIACGIFATKKNTFKKNRKIIKQTTRTYR